MKLNGINLSTIRFHSSTTHPARANQFPFLLRHSLLLLLPLAHNAREIFLIKTAAKLQKFSLLLGVGGRAQKMLINYATFNLNRALTRTIRERKWQRENTERETFIPPTSAFRFLFLCTEKKK
jgi:hypothetical protein